MARWLPLLLLLFSNLSLAEAPSAKTSSFYYSCSKEGVSPLPESNFFTFRVPESQRANVKSLEKKILLQMSLKLLQGSNTVAELSQCKRGKSEVCDEWIRYLTQDGLGSFQYALKEFRIDLALARLGRDFTVGPRKLTPVNKELLYPSTWPMKAKYQPLRSDEIKRAEDYAFKHMHAINKFLEVRFEKKSKEPESVNKTPYSLYAYNAIKYLRETDGNPFLSMKNPNPEFLEAIRRWDQYQLVSRKRLLKKISEHPLLVYYEDDTVSSTGVLKALGRIQDEQNLAANRVLDWTVEVAANDGSSSSLAFELIDYPSSVEAVLAEQQNLCSAAEEVQQLHTYSMKRRMAASAVLLIAGIYFLPAEISLLSAWGIQTYMTIVVWDEFQMKKNFSALSPLSEESIATTSDVVAAGAQVENNTMMFLPLLGATAMLVKTSSRLALLAGN